MEIGDKIKYRKEDFRGNTIGYKIGIVVGIRPYMLTRQQVIFCVTGWIGPDGKESQPNFVGEVHDMYPHGDNPDVEIIEKGCPVEGLEVLPFWEKKIPQVDSKNTKAKKQKQENITKQMQLF